VLSYYSLHRELIEHIAFMLIDVDFISKSREDMYSDAKKSMDSFAGEAGSLATLLTTGER
jgi:hypothetical protein